MIKSVEQETIKAVLQAGVDNHTISVQEMEEALSMTTWDELQPVLDRAQGIDPVDPAEDDCIRASTVSQNSVLNPPFLPSHNAFI